MLYICGHKDINPILAQSKEDIALKNRERMDRNQAILNEIKGRSGCIICGYKRCLRALHMHHVASETKTVKGRKSKNTLTGFSTERMLREASKCVTVCANCHTEIHNGFHPEYLIEMPDCDAEDFPNQLELMFN